MAKPKRRHRKAISRGKRFLILCEGQTERLYFKSFHDKGVSVEPRDPNGDRKRAKKLFNKNKEEPFHRQNPVTTVFELVEELLSAKK